MQFNPAIIILSIFITKTSFAQNTKFPNRSRNYFSADSLVGIWVNCATEFERKIKTKNTETVETVIATGNTCAEIHFNQDYTGSIGTSGSSEPSYIKFSWFIRNNILFIENLINVKDSKSNYLSNGQYTVRRRHTSIASIATQIILIDSRNTRYILSK